MGYLFDLSRSLNRTLALPSSGEKEEMVGKGKLVFHHLGGLIGINLILPMVWRSRPRFSVWPTRGRMPVSGRTGGGADQIRQELLSRGYLVEDREGKSFVRSSR